MSAVASPIEHRKFCEIEGWELLKDGRGKGGRDHFYYTKKMPDGSIARTKISHNKKQYGPGLWHKIYKNELKLNSPEQFWDVIKTRKPAEREHLAPEQTPTVVPEELPVWLEKNLVQVVGLGEHEVAEMDISEAMGYWNLFCGVEETAPSMDLDRNKDREVDSGRSRQQIHEVDSAQRAA